MTEPLILRYRLTPDLTLRAMTAWQEPFDLTRKRRFPFRFMIPLMAGGLAVGIAASAGLLDIVGIAAVNGVLFGFIIGMVFWYAMHRRQMGILARFAAQRIAAEGETELRLDATGLTFANASGHTTLRWSAIDAVIAMPDATALRIGAVLHPVPDAALPPGMTPDSFRTAVLKWRDMA